MLCTTTTTTIEDKYKNIECDNNNDAQSQHCWNCGSVCDISTYNVVHLNDDILNTEMVQCASHIYGNKVSPYNTTTTTKLDNTVIALLCSACARQVTYSSFCRRQINSSIQNEENISQDIVDGETQLKGSTSDSSSPSSKWVVQLFNNNNIKEKQVPFNFIEQPAINTNCQQQQLQHQIHEEKYHPDYSLIKEVPQSTEFHRKTNEQFDGGSSSSYNCANHQCKNKSNYQKRRTGKCIRRVVVPSDEKNIFVNTKKNVCEKKCPCSSSDITPGCHCNNTTAGGVGYFDTSLEKFCKNCFHHHHHHLVDNGHSTDCIRDLVECRNSVSENIQKNKDISEKSVKTLNQCNLVGEFGGGGGGGEFDEQHRLLISPNSESFEASNRLRRLENRFKDLAFTKKLLRDFSSSNRNLSTTHQCNSDDENISDYLRSKSVIDSSSTIKYKNENWNNSCCKNCIEKINSNELEHDRSHPTEYTFHNLPQLNIHKAKCKSEYNQSNLNYLNNTAADVISITDVTNNNEECGSDIHESAILTSIHTKAPITTTKTTKIKKKEIDEVNDIKKDQSEGESEKGISSTIERIKSEDCTNSDRIINQTPVSITESDQIVNKFVHDTNESNNLNSGEVSENKDLPNVNHFLSGDFYTNCEFDVRHLDEYSPQLGKAFECYDELEYDSEPSRDDDDDDTSSTSCDCSIEAVPLVYQNYSSNTMREAVGPLRGLLKKPNRPPPVRKNRVVFDETRNKFFDADYIILIREDCPYDEEDEEPCTCGEHELVRLCCEEGCQCSAYGEDNRTPQVST